MSGAGTPRHTRIGRYEVARWLGSGSFAAVYLGYDPALDAPVALKVLGDHHASSPEIRERFIQEARMLRRLSSDRVVTVRDIGEIDGQPYFVMDAFELGTLADRLDQPSSTFSVSMLRHLVNEIELCLAAVHDGGLVHRDVKPSNLLISRPGDGDAGHTRFSDALLAETERLVVGDFGIARNADATGLTRGAGTYGFMAPEQDAPLTTVDHRVDIFAATAIVELVAQRVWAGTETPTLLADALQRGMAVDPDDRPSSAAEWAAMVRAALPATAPLSTPTAAAPVSAPVPGTQLMPQKRRLPAVVIGAVAAVVVLAGLLVFTLRDQGPAITGPDQVQLGTTAVYSYEPQDNAAYLWTDSAGGTHTSPALEITPKSTGSLTLTLEETIDGSTESSSLRVLVVDP